MVHQRAASLSEDPQGFVSNRKLAEDTVWRFFLWLFALARPGLFFLLEQVDPLLQTSINRIEIIQEGKQGFFKLLLGLLLSLLYGLDLNIFELLEIELLTFRYFLFFFLLNLKHSLLSWSRCPRGRVLALALIASFELRKGRLAVHGRGRFKVVERIQIRSRTTRK